MSVRILVGDVRDRLRDLDADSIDCVVTSPPYWGLRDYGVDGQLGMELTLGEHIETLVDVFREIRRVIKPTAAVWLNYGDCYATSPNGRSAADTKAAGNDDRTFRDKPFSTIGPIYDPHHRSRGERGNNLDARPQKEAPTGRVVAGGYLKPKDLCLIPFRLVEKLQEPYHIGPITHEVDRAWLAGLIDGDGTIGIRREDNGKWNPGFIPYLSLTTSDTQLAQRCVEITGLGKVNPKGFAGDTDVRGIKQRRDNFVWRLDGQIASRVIRDIYPYLVQKRSQALVAHAMNLSQGAPRPTKSRPVAADIVAYRQRLYEAIKSLNHRGDVLLPNLPHVEPNIEPGWWVRSRCIWGKPNGMPDSSGRYRPSVAHEEIFLLSKSGDIWYDSEAVKSPPSNQSHGAPAPNPGAKQAALGRDPTRSTLGVRRGKQRGHTRRHAGFNDRWDAVPKAEQQENGRLLRTYEPEVWHIATAAFGDAHFATFPPALVERCLIASCPPGGAVLDPFGGSGTTGMVADGMGFDAVLIELSEAYAEIARKRIADVFRPVWIERKDPEQLALLGVAHRMTPGAANA